MLYNQQFTEKENVKMKIKIFGKKDTLELEKEVNSFMEE